MARYLSTQYPNKNSTNQCNSKKGDKIGKKGDDPKSKKKDSNTAGTAGAHIEDTTLHGESTTSSGGVRIGAHVLKTNEQLSVV